MTEANVGIGSSDQIERRLQQVGISNAAGERSDHRNAACAPAIECHAIGHARREGNEARECVVAVRPASKDAQSQVYFWTGNLDEHTHCRVLTHALDVSLALVSMPVGVRN